MQSPLTGPQALGAHIRQERHRQGLRQSDLAAAAGTSVRFIVEVERGKATARIGKVFDLLEQLGLRLVLDGLSGETDDTPARG